MKKTIATFAFLTMALAATANDHYWIGPVTGGRWSDKTNWSRGSVPNRNLDGCIFTNDVTIITDYSSTMSTLKIQNGCHVTFKGDETLGTTLGVSASSWSFSQGASVTIDGAYLRINGSTGMGAGAHFTLTNNCLFVGYDAAGGLGWPANSYVEINGGCRYTNFGIGGSGTNCTFIFRNGANITASDKATMGNMGKDTTILLEGGSSLTHKGEYNTGYGLLGGSVIVRGGSTLTINGMLCLNKAAGNLMSAEGGSTISMSTLYTGSGTVVSNENSTISVSGKLLMAQPDANKVAAGGEQFNFVGEDAQMIVAGAVEFNNVAAASAGATFNFAVPELGYKDAPFRATSTSAKIFGKPTNIKPNGVNEKFVHVNLLANSPALDPAYAFATLSRLFFTYSGIENLAYLDCQVEGADNRAEFLFTTIDGQTQTATAANVRYVLARMENGAGGKPLRTRAITESKGVAENTTASVSRRTFTVTSAVTQLAEAPLETYAVLYAGETTDTLVPVATNAISAPAVFRMTWSGSEFAKTYRMRIALETRNALGNVTHVEWSPVRSLTTLDTTTYTWRDVDGDWTGDWGDARHWTNNQNGDCLGRPMTADATVEIPAEHPIVINLDAAYSIGKITTVGAPMSLRFVVPAGMRDANKLTSSASDYWSFGGAGNAIVFDGVNVSFANLCIATGKNTSLVFTNSAYCVFRKFEVHNPGATIRILDGSYVETQHGDSLLLGSPTEDNPGIVIVDDATFCPKYQIRFYSVAASVAYSSILIRGRRGKITSAGYPSGDKINIYSDSTYPNTHRIVFDVPEGGYAATPFQITGTGGKPAFYLKSSSAKIGAIFEITGDSAAYDPREEEDLPLFTNPNGINKSYVTFTRPKHAGGGNTFLYGTATASPFDWTPVADFTGTAKAIGIHVCPPPHTVIMLR